MHLIRAALLAGMIALAPLAVSAHGGGGHSGGHSRGHAKGDKASDGAVSDHFVHGYFRKNGTYVRGYYATNPDSIRDDNYSTRGNVNPYTGKAGTKPRDEDIVSDPSHW